MLCIANVAYATDKIISPELLTEHRTFLERGYESGILLTSGLQPGQPVPGAAVILQVNTLEEAKEFFAEDPYIQAGISSIDFTIFTPRRWQPCLDNYLSDEKE